MKGLTNLFLVTLVFILASCLPTKTVSEPKIVNASIEDLSGKWTVDNGSDYIIFEDITKKMVLKTACGIISGDYTKINQAIIFNQLKQVSADCEIPQNLIENLRKTAYFKVNSTNQITFYDESHQEKLTLNISK